MAYSFLTTDRQLFYDLARARRASYGRAYLRAIENGTDRFCWVEKTGNLSAGIEVVKAALAKDVARTSRIIDYLAEFHELLTAVQLAYTVVPFVAVGGGTGVHNLTTGKGILDGAPDSDPNPLHITQAQGQVILNLQLAGNPTQVSASVPLLNPARTDYPPNFLVQYTLNGQAYLFRTTATGGPFPAPATYLGNGDWQAVALPTQPTVLQIDRFLDYTQAVEIPQNSVKPVIYNLSGLWNGSTTTETVAVRGLPTNRFAAIGQLLLPGQPAQTVTVDVGAGTYGPPVSGSPYIDGDANGNVVVGLAGSPGLGVITSTGNGNLILNGDSNSISGSGTANVISNGSANIISGSGSANAIYSGDSNTISGAATNCTIIASEGSVISGGTYNAISGGSANTIPATCNGVFLLNCLNFTPPANTTNATYINNVLVGPGTGGGGTTAPGGTNSQLQYNNNGAFAGSVLSQANGNLLTTGNLQADGVVASGMSAGNGSVRSYQSANFWLDLLTSGGLSGIARFNNGNLLGYIIAYNTSTGDTQLNAPFGGASMLFKVQGATAATLLPNGNLGIGTTTPVAKLDVNGAVHLMPVAEPAQPASGATFYCDAADGRVYVKDANGAKNALT
ncbi:MAG: hypothetical protein ACRYFX_18965 [Janthinobacterium lividum]